MAAAASQDLTGGRHRCMMGASPCKHLGPLSAASTSVLAIHASRVSLSALKCATSFALQEVNVAFAQVDKCPASVVQLALFQIELC